MLKANDKLNWHAPDMGVLRNNNLPLIKGNKMINNKQYLGLVSARLKNRWHYIGRVISLPNWFSFIKRMATYVMLLSCMMYGTISTGAENIDIRGDKLANWWIKGEPVVFKSQSPLPDSAKISVRVFNSNDEKIYETSIPASVFNKDGWSWHPPGSGFFQADFSVDSKVIDEKYRVSIRKQDVKDKRKYHRVDSREFAVSRHSFVVAPGKSAPPDDIAPCFGVSPHFSMYEKVVPLLQLIGFHSLRVHGVRWANVEKERGKLDWSSLDDFMKLAREQGFEEKNIVFNVFATPRWASTRPKANWINICIHEYSTVIPRDMDDWRNFLRLLIQRYPGVARYELWNEPHLPGFSCFWDDTPENFVKLLKAGYETVKAEKPDATVWLGGIGMRYLPFYDVLLRLGGGKYFDVLALHCRTITPEPFNEINRKYGVPEKPAVTSEWHAILLKPMIPEYPSEKILARDMLIRFLDQIRAGITQIDLFAILNLSRMEKETLPFYREHSMTHPHVSGMFRHLPYIQPRYPALAWHNFTAQVKGQLKVGDGFLFGKNNAQRAILLESDYGRMLIAWNDSEETSLIDPRLVKAIAPSSKIITPEGMPVNIDAQFQMQPEEYYIIRDPEMSMINQWNDNKGNVLLTNKAALTLEHKYRGAYRHGAVFDDNFKLIDPEQLAWEAIDHAVVVNPNIPKAKVSGRFAIGFTSGYMDLVVEVEDPIHYCKTDSIRVWNEDSIQFAIDTSGEGYDTGRLEFEAGLVDEKKAVIWKVKAPDTDGDIPVRYSRTGSRAKYAKTKIIRKGEKTIYKVRIEASELYPFVFNEKKPVRFSMLINNNDGHGRSVYVEWGSGIGGVKNPAAFGTLTIQLLQKEILSQKDLNGKGWKKDYELQFLNTDGITSVKVIGTSPYCSGVRTRTFPIVPGAGYVLSMEVRGSCRFRITSYINGSRRKDILTETPLSLEWKKCEFPIITDDDAERMSILCFAWNQPDCWFEIRNFKLQAQ